MLGGGYFGTGMALSIRNLKIRQQILLVTLPPLFVLLSALGLTFYAYWMATRTARTAGKSADSLAEAQSLFQHLSDMQVGVRGYLLTRDNSALRPYEDAAPSISQELKSLRQLEADHPKHLVIVGHLETAIQDWESQWAQPTIEQVRRKEPVDVALALESSRGRMATVRQLLVDFLSQEREEELAEKAESQAAMKRLLVLAVAATLAIAVVVLAVTQRVAGVIAQPVRQLIEASEQVSRGDFLMALPAPADNEFGVLSKSFARMTTALRQEREELAALNKFSEAVTQCTSESEVYEHILHLLKERFGARQVIIFSLNSPENYLEAAASLVPLAENVRGWPVIDEPHHCKAVRMGRRFCVNDVTLEPLCSAKFTPPAEGSYYCGPLIAGGIIIGAVRLEGMKNYWTPERESLLESYLSGVATGLSNLRLLATMKHQANVDPLTGLYNRRFLEDYAQKLIAMARRRNMPLGVIMLDLDNFKTYNDRYGHEVGDRVLRRFAATVTQAMRETNLAARFGGEEFVVLLPETGAAACFNVAERIREAVGRMVVPSGTDKPLPQITVSLGIAVYPEHGLTLEEVLQASDKALYESKHAGRNRSTLYVEQPEPTG